MGWGGRIERGLGVFKQSVIVNLPCFNAGHAVIAQVAEVFALLDRGRQ